jgi:hypothetical protein
MQDIVGLTPLHYAALAGQAVVCDLLCRRLLLKGRSIDDLVKPSASSSVGIPGSSSANFRQVRAAVRNVHRQLEAHSQALQMAVIDKWRAQRVLGEATDSPLATGRGDDDSWNDLLVGLGTPVEDMDVVAPLQHRQQMRLPSRKLAAGGVSMFLIAHDPGHASASAVRTAHGHDVHSFGSDSSRDVDIVARVCNVSRQYHKPVSKHGNSLRAKQAKPQVHLQ